MFREKKLNSEMRRERVNNLRLSGEHAYKSSRYLYRFDYLREVTEARREHIARFQLKKGDLVVSKNNKIREIMSIRHYCLVFTDGKSYCPVELDWRPK